MEERQQYQYEFGPEWAQFIWRPGHLALARSAGRLRPRVHFPLDDLERDLLVKPSHDGDEAKMGTFRVDMKPAEAIL